MYAQLTDKLHVMSPEEAFNQKRNLTHINIHFCGPFIFEFIKESKEIILATKKDVEREINDLVPVKIELLNQKIVLINFDFVLSMIVENSHLHNGKFLNAELSYMWSNS